MQTKEERALYKRKYYERNLDKAKEYNKKSYLLHRDKKLKQVSKQSKTLKGKYKIYMNNAIKRNYIFELTFEEFTNLTSSNCYYCNSSPENGVDRLDNNLGYIIENCVPCCTMCNIMKNKYSFSTFIDQCKLISEKFK